MKSLSTGREAIQRAGLIITRNGKISFKNSNSKISSRSCLSEGTNCIPYESTDKSMARKFARPSAQYKGVRQHKLSPDQAPPRVMPDYDERSASTDVRIDGSREVGSEILRAGDCSRSTTGIGQDRWEAGDSPKFDRGRNGVLR